VFRVEGSVVEEGLMLLHSGVEGNVVVLNPTTERVEEENGVLVAELEELNSGVLEKENVSVVERVSELESVDCISVSLLDLVVDFSGGESVLVHAVVEGDLSDVSYSGAADEVVTLGHDSLDLGVLEGEGAEDSSADFFLSVFEEDGVLNDSEDFVVEDLGASEGDSGLALQGFMLL
jgi:hypothetical protein